MLFVPVADGLCGELAAYGLLVGVPVVLAVLVAPFGPLYPSKELGYTAYSKPPTAAAAMTGITANATSSFPKLTQSSCGHYRK